MKKEEISSIVNKQRQFFKTGATFSVETRILYLKKLQNEIVINEKRISDALYSDLGKSGFEGYMCETGLVLDEIRYMLKHINKFAFFFIG